MVTVLRACSTRLAAAASCTCRPACRASICWPAATTRAALAVTLPRLATSCSRRRSGRLGSKYSELISEMVSSVSPLRTRWPSRTAQCSMRPAMAFCTVWGRSCGVKAVRLPLPSMVCRQGRNRMTTNTIPTTSSVRPSQRPRSALSNSCCDRRGFSCHTVSEMLSLLRLSMGVDGLGLGFFEG